MASLRCTVATPTRELFSGEIHYASVPGAEGSYGVLPGHEMLVSSDKQGILTLWLDEAGNTRRQFLLYEGAAQVYQDTLTVLGRFGTDLDTLDVEVVKEKAEALRQQIEDLEGQEGEQARVALENCKNHMAWYDLQLKVAAEPAK
ncbi:FoF1 ATP synthase subunit delta/epsilon [Adlercreutzia faecimuris]|uniref:ATP synthase epsilon chain n=1 Tax=Adlercreutzia faecimuris TaxID=2897341 RepID=A0ABS9WFP9_9ACTN|nr:F0F1 ATP synthase subunit epsilon [Adlercreutzia sp. JBNU-10]MCI2241693.1 F0F1 ATP synthase subunit epsilon [Adlercreutzia sp. JBNU-10]